MLCGWGKNDETWCNGSLLLRGHFRKKRMLSACWPSLWHHHTQIMSGWKTKALGVTRQHSFCLSAALWWRVPLLKRKKSNSSSLWMLSLYWRSSLTTPRATSQQPLHYVPMVTIQNVSERVWERSNCLFMCVCYSCVAYFYIMNQLSRVWRELIWIIADRGKRFCTQTWFYWASAHGISFGEGAALGVCGGGV